MRKGTVASGDTGKKVPGTTFGASKSKATPTANGTSSASGHVASPTKLSDRLNPKTVNHFSTKSGSNTNGGGSTSFSVAYCRHDIPCRLVHGSVKHRIEWTQDPNQFSTLDPLLIYFADGLQETVHPYAFLAEAGFKELMSQDIVHNCGYLAVPLLPAVVPLLRQAIRSANPEVFQRGVNATSYLSDAVGESLNSQLKVLLQPLASRANDKKLRPSIMDLLMKLGENGGREACMAIKAKVPTFCPSLM